MEHQDNEADCYYPVQYYLTSLSDLGFFSRTLPFTTVKIIRNPKYFIKCILSNVTEFTLYYKLSSLHVAFGSPRFRYTGTVMRPIDDLTGHSCERLLLIL